LSLPLVAVCPRCNGLKHHRDTKFCGVCGAPTLLTRDYPTVIKSEDFK
jgi:ribosomal protein L37E